MPMLAAAIRIRSATYSQPRTPLSRHCSFEVRLVPRVSRHCSVIEREKHTKTQQNGGFSAHGGPANHCCGSCAFPLVSLRFRVGDCRSGLSFAFVQTISLSVMPLDLSHYKAHRTCGRSGQQTSDENDSPEWCRCARSRHTGRI